MIIAFLFRPSQSQEPKCLPLYLSQCKFARMLNLMEVEIAAALDDMFMVPLFLRRSCFYLQSLPLVSVC